MLERVTHIIEPRVMGHSALVAVADLCHAQRSTVRSHQRIAHRAVVLGGTTDARHAQLAGLKDFDRMALPAGLPYAASRTLHRLLIARPAVDLLVCWSARALALAWLADHRLPRAAYFTAHEPASPHWRRGVMGNPLSRALMRRTLARAAAATHVFFATAPLRAAWNHELPGLEGHVFPLGIDPTRLDPAQRHAIRSQWRVHEHQTVVIALGEPHNAIDASTFAYHCGVTSVAGSPLVGVIPAHAHAAERGLRFTERHNAEWRIAIDDRPLWDLLPACDAAWWVRTDQALADAPLRWAAAAGIPIVATDDQPARDLLADYPGARLVPLKPTRLFTRAMIDAFTPRRGDDPPFGPFVPLDIERWTHEFDSHLINVSEHARR